MWLRFWRRVGALLLIWGEAEHHWVGDIRSQHNEAERRFGEERGSAACGFL